MMVEQKNSTRGVILDVFRTIVAFVMSLAINDALITTFELIPAIWPLLGDWIWMVIAVGIGLALLFTVLGAKPLPPQDTSLDECAELSVPSAATHAAVRNLPA